MGLTMSAPVYFPGYLSSCIKSVSYIPMDKLPDEFKQRFREVNKQLPTCLSCGGLLDFVGDYLITCVNPNCKSYQIEYESSDFSSPITSEIANEIINSLHEVTGVMIVQFRSGGKYAYLLPYRVYQKVLWGKSKGKAFHENVKGKYLSVKLN